MRPVALVLLGLNVAALGCARVGRIEVPDGSSGVGLPIRHAYATQEPWSRSGRWLLLGFSFPGLLVDGRTLVPIGPLRQPAQALWARDDEDELIGARLPDQIVAMDVRNGVVRQLHRFKDAVEISLGEGEGNLSDDGRRLAVLVRGRDRAARLVLLDPHAGLETASRSLPGESFGANRGTIDAVTVSRSGRFVVIKRARPASFILLDSALTELGRLPVRATSHFDLCWTARGREVLLAQSKDSRALVTVDLESLQLVQQLADDQMTFGFHVSCRGPNGHAVVSEYPTGPGRYEGRVFDLILDGSGRTSVPLRIPQVSDVYAEMPFAVAAPGGDRVLYFAQDSIGYGQMRVVRWR